MISYTAGQQYGMHHDCNGCMRRFATVLLYLSDVDSACGGQTVFPAASDAASSEGGSVQEAAHLASVEDAIAHYMDMDCTEHRGLAEHLSGGSSDDAATPPQTAEASPSGGGEGIAISPCRGDARPSMPATTAWSTNSSPPPGFVKPSV